MNFFSIYHTSRITSGPNNNFTFTSEFTFERGLVLNRSCLTKYFVHILSIFGSARRCALAHERVNGQTLCLAVLAEKAIAKDIDSGFHWQV